MRPHTAPLLIVSLFVLRVLACSSNSADTSRQLGGPTSGSTLAVGPASPACAADGVISYSTNGPNGSMNLSHQCTVGCTAKPSAPLVACVGGSEPAFELCWSAQNCTMDRYCQDASSETRLGSPACIDGVCEWMDHSAHACPGGQYCSGGSCSASNGTTSGGFPSMSGAGGYSGPSGTTSGGFPWMGTGGYSGSPGADAGPDATRDSSDAGLEPRRDDASRAETD